MTNNKTNEAVNLVCFHSRTTTFHIIQYVEPELEFVQNHNIYNKYSSQKFKEKKLYIFLFSNNLQHFAMNRFI